MVSPASAAPIGAAGIGASIGGTIMSIFGAKQSGAAQERQLLFQAGMADVAKKVALQNRDYALDTGERQATTYGMGARKRAGEIAAHQSGSGIDMGGGTSVNVREGQKLVTDMDMATIRNNAARKAYGYEVEAVQDEAQGTLYRTGASDVKRATKFNIASSLLSGVSSVSSKWLQGQYMGMWGGTGKSSSGGGFAQDLEAE